MDTEQNITQIRSDVNGLRVEEARQTEQISGIKDVLQAINANMTRMETNLSRIEQSLHAMQTTLAVNTQSLQDHMRRTEVLERRVDPLEKGYWKVLGGFAVASVVGGLVAGLLLKLI